MARLSSPISAASALAAGVGIALAFAASARDSASQPDNQAGRVLESPTSTIRIPVAALLDPNGAVAPLSNAGTLTIRPGAEDQLPEGPQSFAVLDDGQLVVADPLRERLAFYDAAGRFKRAVETSGPVAEVSRAGPGLRIVIATDGKERSIDLEGRTPVAAPASIAPPVIAEVKVDGGRERGTIHWKANEAAKAGADAKAAAAAAPPLAVLPAGAASRLASMRLIAGRPGGLAWVAVESTSRSDSSLESLTTVVRRYAPNGNVDAEIRGIRLDYYLTPTTPFRVAREALYQLYPQQDHVLINVWRPFDDGNR